jgi:hypothetical protein
VGLSVPPFVPWILRHSFYIPLFCRRNCKHQMGVLILLMSEDQGGRRFLQIQPSFSKAGVAWIWWWSTRCRSWEFTREPHLLCLRSLVTRIAFGLQAQGRSHVHREGDGRAKIVAQAVSLQCN